MMGSFGYVRLSAIAVAALILAMRPTRASAGAPLTMPMNQILPAPGEPPSATVESIAPQPSDRPGSGTTFEGVYRLATEAPWDDAAAEGASLSDVCGKFGAECQRLAGMTGAVSIPAYTGDWFKGQLIRTRSLRSGETFQWSYTSVSGNAIWSPVFTWINEYGRGSADFFGGCWSETIGDDTVASTCGLTDEWQFIVGPYDSSAGAMEMRAGTWTIRFYDDGTAVYASTLEIEGNFAAPIRGGFGKRANSFQ